MLWSTSLSVAVTGLALLSGYITSVVVAGTVLQFDVFGHCLPHVNRLHAESRPVNGFELVNVGYASDKPKVLKVWKWRPSPRIDWRTDIFGMRPAREEHISKWPGILHTGSYRNGSGIKFYRTFAYSFSQVIEGLGISPRPTLRHDFERWAIPEVFHGVMGFEAEYGSELQSINRDWSIESHPGTLGIDLSVSLNLGLMLHLFPHPFSDAGVIDQPSKGQNFNSKRYPFVQANVLQPEPLPKFNRKLFELFDVFVAIMLISVGWFCLKFVLPFAVETSRGKLAVAVIATALLFLGSAICVISHLVDLQGGS